MGTIRFDVGTWVRWLPSFLGFPLAGLAARAVAGPIDDVQSAVVGGLSAGLTLGVIQALAQRSAMRDRVRWTVATGLGMATGLAAGASLVGFDTDAASLVVMGAVTGASVGILQAAIGLEGPATGRIVWALLTPVLWAFGWLVTSQVIVDAERQHASFGASGALVVTAISGVVLAAALPSQAGARTPRAMSGSALAP